MTDSSFALESLILFQSVASHGATHQSFAHISEALKSSNLLRQATSVNDDSHYDAKALTDTYLTILKAEAKRATEQSTSRPGSPKFATVEDAAPHLHLVPNIIPRLYNDYKAHLVHEIRQEESRYHQLMRDLEHMRTQARSGDSQRPLIGSPTQRPSSSDKAKLGSILNHDDEATSRRAQSSSDNKTFTTQASPHPHQLPRPTSSSSAQRPDSFGLEGQPSGTPIILPPPPGVVQSSHSPTAPTWTNQSLGPPPGQGKSYVQQMNGFGYDTMSTNGHAGAQQYPTWLQSPYHSHSNAPLAHQRIDASTYGPAPPRSSGGVQLPPFAVNDRVSDHANAATSVSMPQSGHQTYPRPGRDNASSTTPNRNIVDKPKARHPHSTPALANLLNQQPSPHFSPGSWTGWDGPLVPEKGRPRDVSPVTDRGNSPQPPESKRSVRRGKAGHLKLSREAQHASGRGGSKTPSITATSTSQGRTRSQSIVSNVDDYPLAGGSGGIKDSRSSISTPTPGDRLATRHIRNEPSITTANVKRKRRDSTADSFVTAEAAPSPLAPRPPQQRPDTIVASHNFERKTRPLMNNIASHKFASRFSIPVRKNTAGYYEAIREPTDLKTIKAQLGQGNKAVIAAAASMDSGSPSGDTADTGSMLLLPYSDELEPPKAIVNADQLEQELMRMFANAAMFNEGNEGGVVAEAREMCADALKVLAEFRGAEGGAFVMEDEGGSSAKRRRA